MHPHPDPRASEEPDALEELLNSSAPPTTRSDQINQDLQQMALEARSHGRGVGVVRRFPRAAITGAALTLALGGAGAAAAANGWEWSFWDRVPPDGSYTYTLPSGAECKGIIGVFEGPNPVAVEAAENYVRTTDLVAAADIDAALQEVRSGTFTIVHEDGTEEAAGYGTKHYKPDKEYSDAVGLAINTLINQELEHRGFDPEVDGVGHRGELKCPGAQW